ncbi:AP-5 complex subunit sigma-1 [Aplochiton taeniatus]
MVHSFLIHTVCPIATLASGESRILYSRVFGPEESVLTADELNSEERRLLQREKLAVVARKVRTAVSLSREAAGRVMVEVVLGEELVALQEADSGVLRLRDGDPFLGEKSALWLGVQSLGFVLVCEAHENLMLAEGTLRNLTRNCLEQLRMLGPGSEVLLKSDRIDVLLDRMLPHGQLLFLNHRFANSLEKEVTAYMAK